MSSEPGATVLPRVLGVLVTRDEWPLLGISITHALLNHVSKLIVVDHASTDQTQVGLAALKAHWGDRLEVLHLCEGTFHHEEVNLVLKTYYADQDFDWVYPIDADEFLVTENNASLPELLAQVPSTFKVVRYELHNFVAPSDFVEEDLSRYPEITEKAIIEKDFKFPSEDIVDCLISSEVNFFEVPFASKVIFRLSHDYWAMSGSHSMVSAEVDEEFKFPEEHTYVAHLPFLTRDRLIRRAARGADLVKDGYSRNHGWQSQAVYQMSELGRLDEYWSWNSITTTSDCERISGPLTSTDPRLGPILNNATNEFRQIHEQIANTAVSPQVVCEPAISLLKAIDAVRSQAKFNKRNLEANEAHFQRIIADLASENSRLQAANEELQNSVSWKATKFLRVAHRMVLNVSQVGLGEQKFEAQKSATTS